MYEQHADVAVICEQYNKPDAGMWVSDATRKAAIWVLGDKTIQEGQLADKTSYTRAKISGVHIYSCYIPPSLPQAAFEKILDELVGEALTTTPNLIAGDFNAWALEWGSKCTNQRGKALLKAFSLLDVVLLNTGRKNTFEKNGRGSVIDIAFISRSLALRTKWQICDIYTHSDHLAIMIEIMHPKQSKGKNKPAKKAQTKGWKIETMDEEIFKLMLNAHPTNINDANEQAQLLVTRLTKACDAAMIRKKHTYIRKPAYWWNSDIAELRGACHKARRQYQRSRGTSEKERLREIFKMKRKGLKNAIKKSKASCFKELCAKADENPWGGAYKLVMSKISGCKGKAPTCPIILKKVVETLFPRQEDEQEYRLTADASFITDIPTVTETEVNTVLGRFGNTKAPGLDGIPNGALKLALKEDAKPFTETYQKCFRDGVFPKIWKQQRLVLLPKPNKTPGQPSSYRPLCMIDTMGKILERLIADRLEQHVTEKEGLSDNQYGFRRGRSTIDAIKKLTSIAENAIEGTRWMHGTKEYCAVITLDVKNAFNSACWSHIMQALGNLDTPPYLLRLIKSYLSDRILLYDTDEGVKQYRVTGGVPQGSVLGPLLWNVLYDGILRIPIPKAAQLIGYADDIALAIVAKELHQIKTICSATVHKLKNWLSSSNLQLAGQKTEAVLITSRKKIENITLSIDGHNINTQPYLKYLGVMIDARLNFKVHIEKACEKAARVNTALSRIMANIGGPSQNRRLLLAKVTQSIVMYAAPVWGQALKYETYGKSTKSLFRLSAIRVASAFRTVSHEAIGVISGIMPPDIMALESKRIYDKSRSLGRSLIAEERKEIRYESLSKWQRRWDITTKGRWTHRLISDVQAWVDRKHGNVDFYMTQFLTGHGCFREYLHKYGHDDGVICSFCAKANENAEHIFFHCQRYSKERELLENQVAQRITPDNVVPHMLQSKEVWDGIKNLSAFVLNDLRQMERRRKSESIAIAEIP